MAIRINWQLAPPEEKERRGSDLFADVGKRDRAGQPAEDSALLYQWHGDTARQ